MFMNRPIFLDVCLHLLVLFTMGLASGPPVLSDRPHQHSLAKVGKTARLSCPAVNADFREWRKDGEKIHDGWIRFKETSGGLLRIRDVQMIDAGIYVCRATNGFGSVAINHTFIVIDEENGLVNKNGETFLRSPDEDLSRDSMAPIFKDLDKMVRDASLVKPVGSTVRLRCRASGNPEPRVTWLRDGRPVDTHQDDLAGHKSHWVLKLAHITAADTGQYKCQVYNRLGQNNFTYDLEVIDLIKTKPKLVTAHPQNQTVELGETASFHCRVNSAIKPHIKWLRQVDGDGDSQVFLNSSIHVKDRGRFVVLRTSGEMWTMPDGSYLNKLVLHGVSTGDSGLYICLAANINGYSLRTAHLTVILPDSVDSDSPGALYTSHKLALFIGIPVGASLVLVLVIALYNHNYNCCNRSRPDLKGRRLPLPTHERDNEFYSSYNPDLQQHSSPTVTNSAGGGGTVAVVISSGDSNNVRSVSNVDRDWLQHCKNAANAECDWTRHYNRAVNAECDWLRHYNSLKTSKEGQLANAMNPSLDFGSDISSASQFHRYQQPFQMMQKSPFFKTQSSSGY